MAHVKDRADRLYVGVDVGGTKILAAVAEESGVILQRERCPTPRDGDPAAVLAAIEAAIRAAILKEGVEVDAVAAIGLAIPGVVEPDEARVVVTPNMSLSGVAIGSHIGGHFKIPVAVGNDTNLGTLGEKWLGSARTAQSAMGIFVGTGIGGGFVQGNKLWRGAREAGSEIGHIIMQINGPLCGCGNRGCFEALASRTAIERELRAAVDSGRESKLTELLDGDLSIIRSGAIRKALLADDAVVTEVMRRATEVLGFGCLTVRHLLDPEVIVLGGGVVEACSEFIMPIVENIVGSDQLPGAREGGHVLLSALGDDAVVLGAVALAASHIGRNPLKKQFTVRPKYPQLRESGPGEMLIDDMPYKRDVYINVNGKAKKRKKDLAREEHGTAHNLGPKELEKVCQGGPEVLFIATGHLGRVELTDDAKRFLQRRSIECQALPTPAAVAAYNQSEKRKAAFIHVTC